ncbi:MAG: heavy metal translocating P-type ATPase [Chitinophagaceae bacterium]|nr:MAG: heavy metal translocating P-type ATPase [Chitinophagaceae bacterium]
MIVVSKPIRKYSPDQDHSEKKNKRFSLKKEYLPAISGLILLLAGIIADDYAHPVFFKGTIRIIWYVIAYLPVGLPLLKKAVRSIAKGNVFTEFFLMSLATIGALAIGQYPESVAVMLFYSIGELFQSAAVNKAKENIKALLDIRPDKVSVLRRGLLQIIHPSEVEIGEIIQIKPGEKVALDGDLLSEKAAFNTAALTGESKPDNKYKGEKVVAGMINLSTLALVKVTSLYKDSKLSKILQMVQEASARKSKTQLFISKFAKIYTPAVVFLAACVCFMPWFFVHDYVLEDWLYRALIFLVISCPCALVISIPLGYFGGIGLASRHGILFKGSNFLDLMAKVKVIVMDKTGTLTKGIFKVQKVQAVDFDLIRFTQLVADLESNSTHPIALAINEYASDVLKNIRAENVEEMAGLGIKGKVNGFDIIAGNAGMLKKFNIPYGTEIDSITDTVVSVAINGKYAGYLTIADEMKEDAKQTIAGLHELHIKTMILSGDKMNVVREAADSLEIDDCYGDLLPEGKVEKLQSLKDKNQTIAFVGDGVNDAPVIALADAGIAMGGLGSDAAIETADIVIQNDQPSKIVTAIKIGRLTCNIVWQNIILALGIKILVLALGAGGIATLWEAVFADMGVALLAILNAVRLLRKENV